MARVTSNRLVEDLNNGLKRVNKTNAPAVESENARFAMVGPFRQANVAASQTGVALNIDTAADSLAFIPAGRAGEIVSVIWGLSAASTHTVGTVQVTVAGTAAGDAVNIDGGGTAAVTDETTPVAFNEGDKLGVNITTSGGWLPTTADLGVWLGVRWVG